MSDISTVPHDTSKTMFWTGWVLTGLAGAFLIFDASIKLLGLEVVTQTMIELGWPGEVGAARMLGVLLIIPTVLYLWPRTSFLGALLLTAYLGGAVATHTRIDSPLFSHILFGVYLGLFVWGGLYLRNPRLRALLPFAR